MSKENDQLLAILFEKYDNPTDITVDEEGRVDCHVDKMPNTNISGRIFAGWKKDLLAEWNQKFGYLSHGRMTDLSVT